MKEHIVEVKTTIAPSDTATSAETLMLLDAARAIAHKAYAPYSRFRVGAAVLLDNGEVVSGSNQENAAYPSGLCAERVTTFYANAHYPEAKIVRLMIYAETDNGPVAQPITPCAACRQVLLEKETTQGSPIRISLAGADSIYNVNSVAELVPLSFVPKSLEG
ncbi:MAG: cytidine deaminase [Bacteroidales bacterium]|nr:cytidine deaminase [Bacteroidales bacterium]